MLKSDQLRVKDNSLKQQNGIANQIQNEEHTKGNNNGIVAAKLISCLMMLDRMSLAGHRVPISMSNSR
jgi:hypothetical protein